jgi:hypothetical protein
VNEKLQQIFVELTLKSEQVGMELVSGALDFITLFFHQISIHFLFALPGRILGGRNNLDSSEIF